MRSSSHPAIWTAVRSVSLGLLVAAAGIGGSDVSLAALTGSQFGLTLLWAIVAGAFIKFTLNEGVARWQVATQQTFLEGACARLGPIARIVFLLYLLPWTFAVGASLMTACAAVSLAAITPDHTGGGTGSSESSAWLRVLLGLGHSIVAAVLVLTGGYALFKRVMGVLTIAMVVLVVIAAALTRPDLGAVFGAIFVPRLPLEDPKGLQWTLAMFGGIGGTVTMLAYGYWMREERQAAGTGQPPPRANAYRIDLAIAYCVTAAFGIALTIVSADVPVHPSGGNLFQAVASRLTETIGPAAGWVYLAGAWCAVWACMLGVWQFIPLLFADFVSFGRGAAHRSPPATAPEQAPDTTDLSRTRAYRAYLLGLATLPALGVWLDFAVVQRAFGIMGSMFIPLVALALLLMNTRRAWVGQRVNGTLTNVLLVIILVISTMGLAVEFARWLGR
jgi:Mn2+/Fe2+ NRAMP family transporter